MIRQAAVLAGGLGTRISAHSQGRPKSLLPVGGRPFLHHLLEFWFSEGIREIVLLLGHGAEEVGRMTRGRCPSGLKLIDSMEREPLGTGGALKAAERFLDKRFLLVNGDTFLALDLASFERVHEAARPDGVVATLALVRHPQAGEKGSVEIGPEGEVVRFLEKGRTGPGLINAGVYLIEREALATIPAGRPVSLEREVFPDWMRRKGGRGLQGVITDAYFVDIGLPEDYLRVRDGFPETSG